MVAKLPFSVVIPAYNAADTIAAAIGSVVRQTQEDLEVIVVDDGSTDQTAAVVRGFDDPRVRLLRQPNRGLPAARNAGIAVANGLNISFLDSDDLLLPRYLELTAQALGSAPDAGLSYTDAYVFDDATMRVRRRTAMARSKPPMPPPADRNGFLLELLRANFVFVAATVPKAVLEEVGGFKESMTSCEDYELWLRILMGGYRAVWVSGPQALYRKHPRQMSKHLATMTQNLVELYDGLSIEDMPTPAHRELLAERRRDTRRLLRMVSAVESLVPHTLISALKRRGLGESWYERAPTEAAEVIAYAVGGRWPEAADRDLRDA